MHRDDVQTRIDYAAEQADVLVKSSQPVTESAAAVIAASNVAIAAALQRIADVLEGR